jgi:hypothetical protein
VKFVIKLGLFLISKLCGCTNSAARTDSFMPGEDTLIYKGQKPECAEEYVWMGDEDKYFCP